MIGKALGEGLIGAARCAIRGGNQNDAMALSARASHGPGGQEGFIVGMGMNEYQGGHACQCRVASTNVRIAHVSDCYAPRTGGIETQVAALARAQAASGDDVCVITATPGDGPLRAGVDHDGLVTVFRVAARMPADIPVHPRTRRRVRQIIQAWRPDVVHIHSGVVSPFAWSAFREVADLGVPRIVTVHSMWGPIAEPMHRIFDQHLPWRDSLTRVTSVSAVAAQQVSAALGASVGVIPNGIDPGLWPIQETRRQPHELRIVSVLRLAPRKRVGALVNILAQAAREFPEDIRLSGAIFGVGPLRRWAQRLLDQRGLGSDVTLTGRLDRASIHDRFATSDLFVQASVRESFGIAALEARTSGVPVLARSQTGAGEFITSGVDGLLVDNDDDMVRGLVDLAHDRGTLLAWRTAAEQTQTGMTWPEVLAQTKTEYSHVTLSD